jgi:hypothetical protein
MRMQVMAASLVEDRLQTNLFMTPFRSPAIANITGTPRSSHTLHAC